MKKWIDRGDNSVKFFPETDSKGRPLVMSENEKRAFRRRTARSWARAIDRLPDFKTMKPEELDAWHNQEAEIGKKYRELENYLKNKAAKKTRSRRSA